MATIETYNLQTLEEPSLANKAQLPSWRTLLSPLAPVMISVLQSLMAPHHQLTPSQAEYLLLKPLLIPCPLHLNRHMRFQLEDAAVTVRTPSFHLATAQLLLLTFLPLPHPPVRLAKRLCIHPGGTAAIAVQALNNHIVEGPFPGMVVAAAAVATTHPAQSPSAASAARTRCASARP